LKFFLSIILFFSTSIVFARKRLPPPIEKQVIGNWVGFSGSGLQYFALKLEKGGTGKALTLFHDYKSGMNVHKNSVDQLIKQDIYTKYNINWSLDKYNLLVKFKPNKHDWKNRIYENNMILSGSFSGVPSNQVSPLILKNYSLRGTNKNGQEWHSKVDLIRGQQLNKLINTSMTELSLRR